MKNSISIAVAALFISSVASAQFGFPPISSTQFQVAGVTQTPQPARVNFSTGLSGSLSAGTLTLSVNAGVFAPLASPTFTGTVTLPNVVVNGTMTGNGGVISIANGQVLGNDAGGGASLYFNGNLLQIRQAAAITPFADLGATEGTPSFRFLRHYVGGTLPTSTSFVFSSGWGTTCASTPATCLSSITGDDNHLKFTVTSTGTGQSASPTITYTFKDGTWTNVPYCVTVLKACSTAADCAGVFVSDTPTATTDVITYFTTPTAARTYTFQIDCTGG